MRRPRAASGALVACALAGLVGGGSAPAAAQGVQGRYSLSSGPRELTLEEAVTIGLEENPDVRASRFRFDATRAGLWEAYGRFLPQVNLNAYLEKTGGGQFLIGGIPFDNPQSYTTYYQFDFSHRLFDAGRDIFRLGEARAERRAADALVDENRLRTAGEIRRQYMASRAAEELSEQARAEIARRRTRRELAQARFDLGAVTRSDVLRAQIGITQAEVDLVENLKGVRSAKLELLRTMGVEADPDSVELVERFDLFEPTFDADSLVRLAMQEHPTLVRLRALREAAESQHWIAKTQYLPTLQADVVLEQFASDTTEFLFEQFEDHNVYRLSLTWELFGGFRQYNLTSQSKAELRAAEQAVRAAELEIESAVRRAYLDLLTAFETQRARAENVELARRDLELAQERYRIGALSFPDLQDAQVTFSLAETDYIRASYDFFVALANLEEASAQPLFPAGRRVEAPEPLPAPPPVPETRPS